MTNRSGYQQRLDNYLEHYRRRYKLRIVLIAVAALLFAALTISLFTAVLGDTLAYSSWLYYPARILLALIAVAIIALLFWAPWKQFTRSSGVHELESSVPEFQGRVETYTDMKRRKIRSPFTALLARDAIRTARQAPVRKLVPSSELIGPVVASVAMLVMSSWLFTAMPLEWKNGLRHLWLGWYQSDILPERAIALIPGDTKIRVGDSLFVNANLTGFQSEYAQLHIRQHSQSDWEVVDMNRQADGNFSFRLYGVGEALEYYVSSAFTKSERANVEVVVPARVESIAITYHFPEWTGLEPRTVEDGADIAAIAGTRVDLTINTDKPFENGQLVLNGSNEKLTVLDDTRYSTSFSVNTDGEYQIAELLDDDRILVTPVHKITVTEDAKPVISFVKPGRDWNATAIEEVTVEVTASDDYALEDVTLHYAINGGDWQSEVLDPQHYEHTFMLEEFLTEQGTPLLAGDLVTYYAKATDREQSVSTDMLFIDIRPFERRFSQSQQSGGGGGGGGQQQEQEISQRQKEILIATWNLIREQEKQSETLIAPEDSATLLADLQETLADQADTLAQRAEARQLLDNDPEVIRFVEYMQEAAKAMRPSAENLAELKLDDAVVHQQRALQYLKRAESIFNDITISRNQSEGGGGGNAGRDMAEMYELEMDLAKNQYETPDTAQSNNQQQSAAADDAFEKLRDLARRQQQLADAAAQNDELSMAERWQQEKLRREIEELKRELEQMQQQQSASSQQQQSQQSQSQQGQQSQSQQGQSQQSQGQQSQGQQQANSQGSQQQQDQTATEQALENLDEALRQLEQAEQNRQQLTPEQMQESLRAASERLQQSVEQVSEERQQQLEERLTEAADSIRDLSQQQQETSRELREALRKSMEARRENRYDSGLSAQDQQRLAEQKRSMQRQLEEFMRESQDTIDRFAEQSPETAERLQQAVDSLDDSKIAELLGISGDMIEEGQAPQAALRETRITDALNNLQNDLFETQDIARNETTEETGDDITAADATATLQQLRESLTQALREQRAQQLTQGSGVEQQRLNRGSGQQGDQPRQSQSQQSGSQQGQSGDSEQSGQLSERGNQAGSWGANQGTLRDQDTVINNGQPQLIEEATRQLEQLAENPIDGVSAETLADMRAMAEELSADGDRGGEENARRIEANVRLLLRQIEQIELQIYREQQALSGVRNERPATVPEGYDRRAADYFRRLSEGQRAGS